MRRFKGFTLTELMIALAVVGIIVAVVTPAIMRTRPNKNKMMVKKTFYATEQIVSTLINDQRLYPDVHLACDAEDGTVDITDNFYCAWGFDYTNEVKHMGFKYGGSADSNGAKSKFLGLFKSSLNVSKDDTSVAAVSGATGEDSIRPVFYTNDGAKWDLTGTVDAWEDGHEKPEDAGIGEILIDVNGDDGPNCRQGEGDCDDAGNDFDQYVIEVLASGKLRISASDRKASEFATINTSIRDSL